MKQLNLKNVINARNKTAEMYIVFELAKALIATIMLEMLKFISK